MRDQPAGLLPHSFAKPVAIADTKRNCTSVAAIAASIQSAYLLEMVFSHNGRNSAIRTDCALVTGELFATARRLA